MTITNQVASPTVLLAEDNPDSSEMIAEYLQRIGFHIILTTNGEEAIKLAKEEKPDVILMDIQMPRMDGLEATRHLKADPQLADIPVIALTALAMRGDRERCFEAGVNAYLSKPVSLKRMADLIQSLID